MTRITWGDTQKRKYEYGVDRGVLFPIGQNGVPWNGLLSVEETIVGGEATPLYFDGWKYLDLIANEDFQANLTAISAPDEFAACEGVRLLAAGLFATQQPRSTFGLCYRTMIGDPTNSKLGYKLHIVYNCTAEPSGRAYSTKSDKVEPVERSWTIDSVPPRNPINSEWPSGTLHPDVRYKPTAHFVIDSTTAGYSFLHARNKIEIVEDILYGTVSTASRMPTQAEVIDALDTYGI